MSDLIGIVGSLSQPSRTRAAVEVALDAAGETHGVETDLLHLAEHDLETADGRRLSEYGTETRAALERVLESRAFVLGTPVYRGSYSGVLKNLLDLVPRGQWQADVAPLENRPVALVATGASRHHFLAADQELRPVMGFFGAYSVGSAYLHGDDFGDDGAVASDAARARLATLGRATVELSRAVDGSDALRELGPQV